MLPTIVEGDRDEAWAARVLASHSTGDLLSRAPKIEALFSLPFAEVDRLVRFGSFTVCAWNGSSGSSFRFRRFLRGMGFLCSSVQFKGTARFQFRLGLLVAQCSATPATVAATPPCSATPLQTQSSVRHLPAQGGGGATPKFLGGVAQHRCYTCKTL